MTVRIVRLYKEYYGKGPTRARTYYWRDLVVVVLRDGFTQLEQTLHDGGRGKVVLDVRAEFQELMKMNFKRVIEEELEREVIAFLSAAHHEPDISVEIFLLVPDTEAAGHAADAAAIYAASRGAAGS